MVAAAAFLATSCSDPEAVPAWSGDKLAPDTTYAADLDGDGTSEKILIHGTLASLTISDDEAVYRSREKWQVVEACLGDTDHDGLLEVVTLLDSDDGRHLGLFAYFGGEYRERLVTSELTPRPLSLQVGADGLVVLTEETASGETGVRTTTYRWNGFGFTALEP